MENFDLFELRQLIRKNSIILLFEGEFSQGILKNLVETLKEKLSMESSNMISDEKYFISRKVYSVFIELSQNIQHYSSEKVIIDNNQVGTGIIIIMEDENYFKVTSGNYVEKTKIKNVIEKCEYINSLELPELKKYYKEKLRAPRPEDSMGAGLGLVQMAKQSENKLSFSSQEVDETNNFLVIEVKISKEV